MRRLAVVTGVALVLASTTSLAWGKGPVKASLKGPGLQEPVTFGGGENAGSDVMMLAESAGLFPALFFESPSPMEEHRPEGRLGPRYSVAYSIPAPVGGSGTVLQYVYPYAAGGPVTYTPPGQPFLEGEADGDKPFFTHGGWFEATSLLKSTLVSAGLPSERPLPLREPSEPTPGLPAIWPVLGVIVLCALALTIAFLRRRGLTSTRQAAV